MSAPLASVPARRAARLIAARLLAAACLTAPAAARAAAVDDDAAAPDPLPDAGAAVPHELLGDWSLGLVYGTDYADPRADPRTRAARPAAAAPGAGNAWRFAPDGRFVNAQLVHHAFEGCTTRVFWYDTGTYAVGGGRITLRSAGMYLRSEDSCHARYNYERTLAGHHESVPYELGGAGGRATLTLRWPDQPLVFRRAR